MNCRGCGVEVDPSEQQVNSAVDRILETSLQDAEKKGGVCPLCGHSKEVPYSNRKTVLFGLLLACLLASAAVWIGIQRSRQTQRAAIADEAVARMTTNAEIVRLLGMPITIASGLSGETKQDETGWSEAHLTIPVRGPNGNGVAHVVGGKGTGPWAFTTFEVDFEKQHEKVDFVSGRIVEYDPNAYVETHTESASVPEYIHVVGSAPRFNGEFPCVFATMGASGVASHLGSCAMPTQPGGPIDRFEADLRYGRFVLRETDLYLDDIFKVPLTRSYSSADWVTANPVHAFGRNSNHPYDIAPVGSRNPYTYQRIALEDGDFLHFDRISNGTGYSDAVYQHTETSTRFYKATQRWNGNGWTTRLADGSEIHFPESYAAKNMAQGAATEMIDANGNRLELRRDPERNLQEIRTPHGHWIRFQYDDQSRIKRAEEDAGNWAQYGYNSDGMLETAILSSGRQRHYEYDGILMTRITDEKGRVLIQNWYRSKVLMRQQFGNGETYSYDYDWKPNHFYSDKVAVTLPDQSRRDVNVADSVPEFVKNYHKR
jgi:YD repeat-containing protein